MNVTMTIGEYTKLRDVIKCLLDTTEEEYKQETSEGFNYVGYMIGSMKSLFEMITRDDKE